MKGSSHPTEHLHTHASVSVSREREAHREGIFGTRYKIFFVLSGIISTGLGICAGYAKAMRDTAPLIERKIQSVGETLANVSRQLSILERMLDEESWNHERIHFVCREAASYEAVLSDLIRYLEEHPPEMKRAGESADFYLYHEKYIALQPLLAAPDSVPLLKGLRDRAHALWEHAYEADHGHRKKETPTREPESPPLRKDAFRALSAEVHHAPPEQAA